MDYKFVPLKKNHPDFVDKNVLAPFEHDVHVHVFTMMYMF